MKPAGMPADDSTCDGCEHTHTDVWWTVTPAGKFRAYCLQCWPHYVGIWL